MIIHEIGELDRTGILLDLDAPERRALARVADRLGIEWRRDGSVRVFARDHVGIAILSEHTAVRIATKIPVNNVLALASLAYRTAPIPPALASGLARLSQPNLDCLALLLVAAVEKLVEVGLRQGYVELEDELPYLRGRVRFRAGAAWSRPGLVACEFTELSPDTPENRLLRATLEMLVTRRFLLSIRRWAEALLQSFVGVSLVRPSRRLLGSCRLTRLNQHYAPALRLCELIVNQLGVELDPGEVRVPGFFFPMAEVFERAVANLFRDRLPEVSSQLERSHTAVMGHPAHLLTIRPDVTLGSPATLVLDTKYKRAEEANQYGGRSFRNDDIYQAAFYALSLGCPAVLIYPKDDQDVDVTFDVNGVRVTLLSVDLQQQGLTGLERLVARICMTQGGTSAPV